MGVNHTGDDGFVLEGGYSIDVTPDRLNDVPEVLEVHVVPSGDVRIVPELPTITKEYFGFFPLNEQPLLDDSV